MFSYVSVMACVCPYNKQVLVDWLVGYHLLSRVIILTNVCVVITVAMEMLLRYFRPYEAVPLRASKLNAFGYSSELYMVCSITIVSYVN